MKILCNFFDKFKDKNEFYFSISLCITKTEKDMRIQLALFLMSKTYL